MKHKFSTIVILVLATFLLPVSIRAQESCTQKLVDAKDLFDMGKIDKVSEMLDSCLVYGFTKQEKIEANRLLTLCHIYYNRTTEAAVSMRNMLKLNPEYKIQDIDPSEFQQLHSTFRTLPALIIGVKGGIGSSHFHNIVNYNDINSYIDTGSYTPGNSFSVGVSLEFPVFKSLSVKSEFYYNMFSYISERNILDYANLEFTEKVSGIEVPIMFQWNILKEAKVTPYINVGMSFYFTLSANGSIVRSDTLSDMAIRKPPSSEFNTLSSRNIFNYGFTANIGVRIKDILGRGYLTFDLRYNRYFRNFVEEKRRADYPEMTYAFMYTDNSFKIQNIHFYIGYKIPLYNPKQNKKYR